MNIHCIYSLVGTRYRAKRMQEFARILQTSDDHTILDVGGYPWTWSDFPHKPSITTLNVHPVEFVQTPQSPRVRTTVGDGCHLGFEDQSFDIVFSNSVIEHLGSLERQQAFASEARRVGRSLWIQTPAREHFVEPHLLAPFIHHLPVRWQRKLIPRFTVWGLVAKPSPAEIDAFLAETRLLSFAEMQALFPDCEIRREKAFGFTKSYVAVRRGPPAPRSPVRSQAEPFREASRVANDPAAPSSSR